jgi:hypothetical protein
MLHYNTNRSTSRHSWKASLAADIFAARANALHTAEVAAECANAPTRLLPSYTVQEVLGLAHFTVNLNRTRNDANGRRAVSAMNVPMDGGTYLVTYDHSTMLWDCECPPFGSHNGVVCIEAVSRRVGIPVYGYAGVAKGAVN